MKRKKLLLPIMMSALLITSCSAMATPPDDATIQTDYYCIMTDDFSTKCEFKYKNDYFRASPKTFDKDFAMCSYIAATNSGRRVEMEKYYNLIGFNNFHFNDVYNKGCGEDTYGMFIASRDIDDFTVISVSFRSFDYTLEWVSNVTLGKEGNHEGFEYSSNNALNDFNEYIASTYAGKNLKLWVNGFSRGGALANMFTTKVLNGNEFGFTEDNTYCYTFEAPAGFTEENRKDYKCIWNLTNPADIVVNVPPAQYGLYRSGTDVNIYRSDFDELFAAYMRENYGDRKDLIDGELTAEKLIEDFPKFDKKDSNEIEFLQNFLTKLLKNDDETYGLNNRAAYVDHIQNTARLASRVLFSLSTHKKNSILYSLNMEFALDNPSELLKLANKILDDEIDTNGKTKASNFLYTRLSRYLDLVEIAYSEEELRSTCDFIPNLLLNIDLSAVLSIATNFQSYRRALYFHWHEASYVLLKALEYQQPEGE